MAPAVTFTPAAAYTCLALTGGSHADGLRDDYRGGIEDMPLDAPRYVPTGGVRAYEWVWDGGRYYVDAQPVSRRPGA